MQSLILISPFSFFTFFCFTFLVTSPLFSLQVGLDLLFTPQNQIHLKGKNVGLVTNHTAINFKGQTSVELFKQNQKNCGYHLKAFFCPEHGLKGLNEAGGWVKDEKDLDGIPVYSLHGSTRRPTQKMLSNISLLVFDIQDIGSRSYTYISTLFYVMEEAAKARIPVLVLDRPNPLGGLLVDGPMLEEKWRSFVGYINVPYCHGMTVGELARYFNSEYKVNCDLTVIPMKGWKRHMTFNDGGLVWIPTSPHIPEAETAFYYPTTGLLGEIQLVNIGVGYTLPFKVVGAPWIDADAFAKKLNEQNFPGVHFLPFHYRPFFGRFEGEDCHGVLISIVDYRTFLPVTTQYLIIGMLKSLYPVQFSKALEASAEREEMFNKVNGTAEIYRMMKNEKYLIWKLRTFQQNERETFLHKRKAYLIYG